MTQALTPRELAARIEHRAEGPLTRNRVRQLCREADELGFGAVSVPSAWVTLAKMCLHQKEVAVSTTIGFPYGDVLLSAKFEEAYTAVSVGASEITFMLNHEYALEDATMLSQERRCIEALIRACRKVRPTVIKVMINVTTLTKDQFKQLVQMVLETGTDFIGVFGASDGRHHVGIDPIGSLQALIGDQMSIVVWNDDLDRMADESSEEGLIDLRHGFAVSFLEQGARRLITTRGPGILHTAKQLAEHAG